MLEVLLVLCTVTLIAVVVFSLLLYKKIRRTHSRSMDEMQRWVVSSLTSIETRLRYQAELPPTGNDDVVIVVSRDRSALLSACVRSIHHYEPSATIIVVDPGSADETSAVLEELRRSGVVRIVIAHAPNTVAQWQKGYGIHEAWRVAALLHPRSITVFDDDMLLQEPMLSDCRELCDRQDVDVVALQRDATQVKNHPSVGTIEHKGQCVDIGTSFNGAAFYLPWKTLTAWGPPPYNEGKRESGVEDWYYSRALASSNGRVAFLPRVVEQQGVVSLRDALSGTQM